MSGTVIVEGHGRVFVEPDTVVIRGDVSYLAERYDDAVIGCASSVEGMRDSLTSIGLDGDAIRTGGSTVRPEFKDDAFTGYRCSHDMTITMSIDDSIVDRVFSTLSAEGRSSFRMDYIVSDPAPHDSKALSLAVRDAKEKAIQLASDAGVELGDIREIRYASDGYRPRIMTASRVHGNTPEDVEFEKSVTIIWEIA